MLSGQKVVVFGGGSGAGLAAAKLLASKGAEVVVTGRSLDKMEAARKEGLIAKAVDGKDVPAVHAFFEELGAFDHLVITAGQTNRGGSFVDNITDKSFRETFDGKFWVQVNAAHAAARTIKKGGSIRLDLADDSLSLRPYDDWSSLWNMIARSAYTQLHYSPWLLAGATLGMLLTYIAPPVLALAGGAATWPAWLAWIMMAASYRPMLREYRQPAWLAPLLPVTALFYLGATLDSARRYWLKRGGQWKGRAQAPVRS